MLTPRHSTAHAHAADALAVPDDAAGPVTLPGRDDDTQGGGHAYLIAADGPAAAQPWARVLAAEGVVVEPCDEPPAEARALPIAAPMRAANDPSHTSPIAFFAGGTLAPHLARLRSLHERHARRPLMVVVRGLRDLDQVLALEMGADDVVDAALAAPVVAARLRVLARRALVWAAAEAPLREPPRELRFGALSLLRLEREVRLADVPVPLTEGEFEVLWLLASHAGQALSRREILKRVRGLDDQPLDRSIDSRVYRIRAKLGDNRADTPRIRTVRHQGYAFSPVGW